MANMSINVLNIRKQTAISGARARNACSRSNGRHMRANGAALLATVFKMSSYINLHGNAAKDDRKADQEAARSERKDTNESF